MTIHFGARMTTGFYAMSPSDINDLEKNLEKKYPSYKETQQLNIGTETNPILLSIDSFYSNLVVLNNRPEHENAGNFLDTQAAIRHLEKDAFIPKKTSEHMKSWVGFEAQNGDLFEAKNRN